MRSALWLMLAALLTLTVIAWRLMPPDRRDGRTLIVWATDNNPVRAEQVELFNRLNPDLYLTIDPANKEQQKVIVQSIGGVGPEIFEGYSAENLESFVRSGIAMDVTDELHRLGVDARSEIWPVGVHGCVYEGRTYAFPRNMGASAIWYNKDVFDRSGVPYPKTGWTWDDLIQLGKRLTKRDSRGKPKQFGIYWDWNAYGELIFQHGGRTFSPDGTECVIDTPEAIAGVQLGHDLMYKHRIAPSPIEEGALSTQGGWGSGGMTFLMGGRVAMAYGGRWWLNLMRQQKDLRLGCIEIPYAKRAVTIGGGGYCMVNRYSKRAKTAVRFLAFLASKEYNDLCNRQADAIAPVRKYAYTDEYLHNPEHPEEDYNGVWRSSLEKAVPVETSPFLKGIDLGAMRNQLDLVKSDLKPVPLAMADAVREANKRIRRNARLQPHLGVLYEQLTGRKP